MTTLSEYMQFFEHWLHYQFPRIEDEWNNFYILKEVAKIVSDADELAHWSNRDCWSMYDLAKTKITATN
jgi:hypothetical protein